MHLTHLENDESTEVMENISGDLWDPIEEYGQEGQSSKTETADETIISVPKPKSSRRLCQKSDYCLP